MKLYILGKNTDDKGSQLEDLTRDILASQGYENIVANTVYSGGSEIDVAASYKKQVGIKNMDFPVICECKAHDKAIVMTDWLKFIGKLYIEKLKNEHTIGLMIALSGANGNVVGSYNDIKDKGFIQSHGFGLVNDRAHFGQDGLRRLGVLRVHSHIREPLGELPGGLRGLLLRVLRRQGGARQGRQQDQGEQPRNQTLPSFHRDTFLSFPAGRGKPSPLRSAF